MKATGTGLGTGRETGGKAGPDTDVATDVDASEPQTKPAGKDGAASVKPLEPMVDEVSIKPNEAQAV